MEMKENGADNGIKNVDLRLKTNLTYQLPNKMLNPLKWFEKEKFGQGLDLTVVIGLCSRPSLGSSSLDEASWA